MLKAVYWVENLVALMAATMVDLRVESWVVELAGQMVVALVAQSAVVWAEKLVG